MKDKIPGVGPATITKLQNSKILIANTDGSTVELAGITSTFGLIAVFMAFKNGSDGPVGPIEHLERFYMWWCSLGMSPSHRSGFCHALASKVNISFPGIYDSSVYGDLDA